MKNAILYATAFDVENKLVHIDAAQKDKDYFCPECGQKLIVRKSGKSGKGSRRPHFAHNELSPNCTPETVLHYSFKMMLANLLNDSVARKEAFDVQWECEACRRQHIGNVLEKVDSVHDEYRVDPFRPDIALLDANHNVIGVFEIVVSHAPEPVALQFYAEKGIPVFQVNVGDDSDLKLVRERATSPTVVSFCLNPKCEKRNRGRVKREVISQITRCGHCFEPRESYFVFVDSLFGLQKSLDFTDDEIQLVKDSRPNIQIHVEKSEKGTYPISVCRRCQAIQRRYRRPRM